MDALKHVQYLAKDIGPRPPTSSAEAKGAEYCARVLEEAGLEVKVEPFEGLGSFGHIYIPITGALFLNALLGLRRKAHRFFGLLLGGARSEELQHFF